MRLVVLSKAEDETKDGLSTHRAKVVNAFAYKHVRRTTKTVVPQKHSSGIVETNYKFSYHRNTMRVRPSAHHECSRNTWRTGNVLHETSTFRISLQASSPDNIGDGTRYNIILRHQILKERPKYESLGIYNYQHKKVRRLLGDERAGSNRCP